MLPEELSFTYTLIDVHMHETLGLCMITFYDGTLFSLSSFEVHEEEFVP